VTAKPLDAARDALITLLAAQNVMLATRLPETPGCHSFPPTPEFRPQPVTPRNARERYLQNSRPECLRPAARDDRRKFWTFWLIKAIVAAAENKALTSAANAMPWANEQGQKLNAEAQALATTAQNYARLCQLSLRVKHPTWLRVWLFGDLVAAYRQSRSFLPSCCSLVPARPSLPGA
jgi:hypothetical protein